MDSDVKQKVRQFYDQVGWQEVGQGLYQNAHYEDLRPVSRPYIQRCHARVGRHLRTSGRYMLDAGSGPIQYPDYLAYSRGYDYRVCADISIVALKEARKRIGENYGMFVVADVANLPFKSGAFEGAVSLHTIHHLPENEHLQAYSELYRVLHPGCSAAVVNGWPSSQLMKWAEPLIRFSQGLRRLAGRLFRRSGAGQAPAGEPAAAPGKKRPEAPADGREKGEAGAGPKGTFTNRHDVAWIRQEVGGRMPVEIYVWRSVSVRFLRSLIHTWLAGRLWLRLLYALEERFPRYFGENGQYPLLIIRKPGDGPSVEREYLRHVVGES